MSAASDPTAARICTIGTYQNGPRKANRSLFNSPEPTRKKFDVFVETMEHVILECNDYYHKIDDFCE